MPASRHFIGIQEDSKPPGRMTVFTRFCSHHTHNFRFMYKGSFTIQYNCLDCFYYVVCMMLVDKVDYDDDSEQGTYILIMITY